MSELQSARLASKRGFKAPPLLRFLLFHRNQNPFFHNDRGRRDGSPGVIAGREGDAFRQRRRRNCSSVCRLRRESWLLSRSSVFYGCIDWSVYLLLQERASTEAPPEERHRVFTAFGLLTRPVVSSSILIQSWLLEPLPVFWKAFGGVLNVGRLSNLGNLSAWLQV